VVLGLSGFWIGRINVQQDIIITCAHAARALTFCFAEKVSKDASRGRRVAAPTLILRPLHPCPYLKRKTFEKLSDKLSFTPFPSVVFV
jgi:hypothetical protein